MNVLRGGFVEHNVGLIEIDWDAGPDITFKALGVDGRTKQDITDHFTSVKSRMPPRPNDM